MNARFWIALAVLLSIAGVGVAEPRIRYAETVQLESQGALAQSKTSVAPTLAFTAYGRAFQTTLESNARVLSGVPAEKQRQLSATPFKGALTGLSGSWVRLTRIGDAYSGAIWDGNELYLVAPAEEVAASLSDPSLAASGGTSIFRLADVEGGISSCGLSPSSEQTATNASDDYKRLLTELKGRAAVMQAATLMGEVEVSVLADQQFAAKYGTDTTSTMIARMNVVDGIFTEQLGIYIVPTDLTTLGSDAPFNTDDAHTLLEQLASFRNARPQQVARGITHLMTGRTLLYNIGGVAYRGGVCDARYGSSLSGAFDNVLTPLIIAHELGHNFGSPHDGEAGSPCASTSRNYLMTPSGISGNTFSACSLQQMQPVIAAASCIGAPSTSDVSVSVGASTMNVTVNRNFTVPITVTSNGTRAVDDVVANVFTNSRPTIVSAQVVGAGSCTVTSNRVDCSLGTLAPGATRELRVEMVTDRIGPVSALVQASARVDRNPGNNQLEVDFNAGYGSDVSVGSGFQGGALVGSSVQVDIPIVASGVDAAQSVSASVFIYRYVNIISATADATTCTVTGTDDQIVQCQWSSIPAGEQRHIRITGIPTQVPPTNSPYGYARVTSTNDGNDNNNEQSVFLSVGARRDAQLREPGWMPYAPTGGTFEYTWSIAAMGQQAGSNNVVFSLAQTGLTIVDADPTSGSCQIIGGTQVECALGNIGQYQVRYVTVTFDAASIGAYAINTSVTSDNDDVRYDNSNVFTINVVPPVDIDVRRSLRFDANPMHGVAGEFEFEVHSTGYNPASGVTFSAVLPASFSISTATMTSGSCTVSGSTVNCNIASLSIRDWATVRIGYVANEPGAFTAQIAGTATGDGNSANNTQVVPLTVRAYTDVRIVSTPSEIRSPSDQLIRVPVSIATDRYPVNNVTLQASGLQYMQIESASADGGTCSIAAFAVACTFASLPANTTRNAELVLRVDPAVTFSFLSTVTFRVSAAGDLNSQNDVRIVPLDVAKNGDASLSASGTSVTGTVGQSIALPPITLTGVRPLDNVSVSLALPTGVSMTSMSATNATCTNMTSRGECYFNNLATGATHTINITLSATAATTMNAEVRLQAAGDDTASNNVASISVTVRNETTGNNGGGGGGGGGGALGWQALLALLLLNAARRLHARRLNV